MPPVEDEGLLDAISTAVEEARPADVRTPPADDKDVPDDPAPAPQADSGDRPAPTTGAPGDDTQAAAGDEGKKPAAAGVDPTADRGDGRNALGHYVKKKGEADVDFEKRKAAAPAVDPKGAQPAKPAAPKPPDHLNDPIPEGLKGKTRERMEFLATSVKSVTTERDTLKEQLDGFTAAIVDTGADPQTFARHVEVLRLMNSEDPAEQQLAIKTLRAAADKLAGETGEPVPGKDPLEGHQDLIDEVEDGDITRARAIEIATARNKDKAAQTRNQRQTQQSDQQREHTTAVNSAAAELNKIEAQLKVSDAANYAWKRERLVPKLQVMFRDIHPSKWVAHFRQQYATLDGLAPPPRVGDQGHVERVPRGTGANQPMRPKPGAGGGGIPEPKSLAEAIDFGIANAARR